MSTRTLSVSMMLLVAVACEVHNHGPAGPDPGNDCYYDHTAPGVPRGVHSVTGDGSVRLSWEPSPDWDTAGYGVYWNDTAGGYYTRIGTTSSNVFHVGSLSNGRTYYFAVDAFDRCGNSSDLSYETVFDTPRPAGYGLRVWEFTAFPDEAGIDFSRYRSGNSGMIVPWDDNGADIYLERSGSSLFLSATAMDTDVMVWGRVQSLDEIDVAPLNGWVPGGSMMVSQSHAYLVWTWDNRFAKIMVSRIGNDSVTLDWAYQTAEGNPELAPQVGGDAPALQVAKPARGDASAKERS